MESYCPFESVNAKACMSLTSMGWGIGFSIKTRPPQTETAFERAHRTH
jgi:hypothetical protein